MPYAASNTQFVDSMGWSRKHSAMRDLVRIQRPRVRDYEKEHTLACTEAFYILY